MIVILLIAMNNFSFFLLSNYQKGLKFEKVPNVRNTLQPNCRCEGSTIPAFFLKKKKI